MRLLVRVVWCADSARAVAVRPSGSRPRGGFYTSRCTMLSLTIGVVAVLVVIFILGVSPTLKRRRCVGAFAGMVVGFLFGIVVDDAISTMHWFGPIDIPNPVVQIGGVATTLSNINVILFALSGLIVGIVVSGMSHIAVRPEVRDRRVG